MREDTVACTLVGARKRLRRHVPVISRRCALREQRWLKRVRRFGVAPHTGMRRNFRVSCNTRFAQRHSRQRKVVSFSRCFIPSAEWRDSGHKAYSTNRRGWYDCLRSLRTRLTA